ncbi:MAG TPA: RagB/SusD family nutrient uptake outer membrane protein [Puia sp.]|jgi:hypothetical protein|nr:RagB/SusD family nutrient uptake outer membrane protein [Puia sp.]
MNKQSWSSLISLLLLVMTSVLTAGCHKDDFLGKNPNSSLVVPSTLTDFQNLLDNDQVMNLFPALGEISADNYFIDQSLWQSAGTRVQNAYTWQGDIFDGEGSDEDWNAPYQQVYYANVVLDGIAKLKTDNSTIATYNSIKGQALFTRAFGLYNVAQLFAPVYDAATAATDSCIPLRLSQDVKAPTVRSTVKQTYDQITGDLRIAAGLLPASVSMTYVNRASRPAAQALLARIYLSMRKYDSAGIYADSALSSHSTLIDYNLFNSGSLFPFSRQNAEVLYQSSFVTYEGYTQVLTGYSYSDCFVDSTLMRSYKPNDLRPSFYYYLLGVTDSFGLKGSYTGLVFPFGGLATDEVYLIRAECKARSGDTTGAASDLNTLLVNRWKTGSFIKYAYATLDTVLSERRKELPFRGVRWSDLRRLNKEGANIKLFRKINGIVDSLAPNSIRYVLPIPPDVLLFSGISNNPR